MISKIVFSAIACAALTAGCAGWGVVATGPSADVEITSAPVEIETAPQVVYEGRPTYYYQNRWYYREGSQWRAYRNEPSGLVQHRRRFQQQPPVRHEERREPYRHEERQQHERDQHDHH